MADVQVIRANECAPEQVRKFFDAVPLDKVLIQEGDDFEAAMRSGQCYKVIDGAGQAVGAYVLRTCGAEVWIAAAAGRAAFDLTAVLSALVDLQARAFDSIAFQTRRPGLIRKARRYGYREAGRVGEQGIIMRKIIQ